MSASARAVVVVPEPGTLEESMQAYVRTCADKVGLRDWTFDIRWSDRPDDPQALADCTPIEGRRYAVLRFHPDFFVLPPTEMRHALVHELVHPHFASLCDHLRTTVAPWMPERTFEMFWRSTVLDLEPAIDAMAHALAPSLPLIEWS